MSRVLCVALALAGLAVADPVMAQRGSGKPVVAVTEFRNESGAAWWRGGVGWELAGMLTNELASTGDFKVVERTGVVYKSKGKVLRQGTWLKARGKRVTVRAHAAHASYRLQGKQVWKMSFRTRPCVSAPEVAPSTGSR